MAEQRPPIGKLLKDHGLVSEEQIQYALQEQRATGERLGECLMRLGLVTDAEVARALAQQSGHPFVDLRTFLPRAENLERLPAQVARDQKILPLYNEEGRLHVAVADPYDPRPRDVVFRLTGGFPEIHVGAEGELGKVIERFYYLLEHPLDEQIEEMAERLRRDPAGDLDVGRMVDMLLAAAISQRATDVHVSPSDRTVRVMFRVDGVTGPAYIFPIGLHNRLVTNIKVRSGMDISEQRKPQDGRMSFEFLGDAFDIRVSTVRSQFGENLVLRLLPARGGTFLGIADLGFEPEELAKARELFGLPYGMVLVTGPTGSGKTTTLYAGLRGMDAISKNILTVEDPIEYEFLLIHQTQVNERAGYTFASAIRTFLRQDPDVILVGEIRDEETAVLATRAALTGHLVLSTLHTNNALGAVARLRDLGISPYLLSTSLAGILAQRLVRRLCYRCKERYQPDKHVLRRYGLPEDGEYYKGKGCEFCRGTGYLGRIAVVEILSMSRELLRLIAEEAPMGAIEDQARAEGFRDLVEIGKKKVLAGETSLDEMQRVLG
ncbi:Flp pilus assembly complex ATPase component [Dissulfurirhabdus thermomarina]|uniref:Flp pilus assembly complex ATPase component n=1 Tax=Dissulfurirhabdus thermomarina TaxID=1765737 RepID=A0A6N9TM55_DISTH|nr:GspE/PulE family protein [Dissulfurirhabdus thermomarina]NDY42315.1 Flp pilus assembly complex ATPase component [Dissulfurirhabdus thermomarina]NMX22422.1 Flp pilus assembly complex ATPase component TadA [Dissulfurirhabdus thermomarina]